MSEEPQKKIRIMPGGPYMVSGNVPLEEKIIQPKGRGVFYKPGRKYPPMPRYALCRCGHSKTMPFCDGHHAHVHFEGKETASREPFFEQAEIIEGPGIVLADVEELCAFARFCHGEHGDSWSLTEKSDDSLLREEALETICACPAGRLVALNKQTGKPVEPVFEPSIVILQDPSRHCSGPLWVRGGIPIESSDGYVYEIRNRVTLCRCGHSENKPFCDAIHVSIQFTD
jgi:CDGSH-type Zn-finger protein